MINFILWWWWQQKLFNYQNYMSRYYSPKISICRTCSETSWLLFAKFEKARKRYFGKGKLTNNMIDRLQNYYGMAIWSNKTSLKGMQSATKAALFHVASNKDHNPHYPHCPVGPASWCKYNKDCANGITTYKPGPGLPWIRFSFKGNLFFFQTSNTKKCIIFNCRSATMHHMTKKNSSEKSISLKTHFNSCLIY